MEAWTQIRKEAMENYDLMDKSDQEVWGKLEPLAEPTPADAKNRRATEKRRRGDEGRDTSRRGERSSARGGQEGSNEQRRREENEDSETEETRRAMAEAIWEMEGEEEETGHVSRREDNGGTEGQRRARTEATRTGPPAGNIDKDDGGRRASTTRTPGRQQSSDEHQEATVQPQLVNAKANANDGEGSARVDVMREDPRTPLQRLRGALRRRFGQDFVLPEARILKEME